MRALVVGQGSIGRRHARLLGGMGLDVAVVSRGEVDGVPVYRELDTALGRHRPSYVVIANRTAEHYSSLATLAALGFDGAVLVEKPLFEALRGIPQHRFSRLAVGYNLRFHPVLTELKRRIASRTVLAAELYAGQWLPDWRPGTDYRASYSAIVREGGGVLRDLSHELDLLQWLFGPWSRLAAIGGRRGQLAIETDDLWTVMFEMTSGAAVTSQLNYLDRPGRRRIVVITPDTTLTADLGSATLHENATAARFEVERDHTYLAQHEALILGGAGEPCTAEEGQRVLTTIAAIERAAAGRCYVEERLCA